MLRGAETGRERARNESSVSPLGMRRFPWWRPMRLATPFGSYTRAFQNELSPFETCPARCRCDRIRAERTVAKRRWPKAKSLPQAARRGRAAASSNVAGNGPSFLNRSRNVVAASCDLPVAATLPPVIFERLPLCLNPRRDAERHATKGPPAADRRPIASRVATAFLKTALKPETDRPGRV